MFWCVGGVGVRVDRVGGREKKKKGELLFFVFRLSTSNERRKRQRGTKKKFNFFLYSTVDASAEVDEGAVDLDGRDRADDDVA